jgi:phosphate:Na+ symporter
VSKGTTLGDFPVVMSVAGLGLGSAIANYLLTIHLKGLRRQIALHQSITNLGAALVIGGLLTVERLSHLPMLVALVEELSKGSSGRVAFTYLALNLAIVAVGIVTLPWAPGWLAALSPPTAEEHLSLPMYVQPEALESPETALDLAAMEQLRVLQTLVTYLKFARGDTQIKLAALHESVDRLSGEISTFLQALVRQPISTSLAARSLSFQRKEETLSALEENVFLFSQSVGASQRTVEIASPLVESLDMILLTAADALGSGDRSDVDLLMQLTEDRGMMMERMRNQLRVDDRYAIEDISILHYATTLFERNVWLLRQLALWMREDAQAAAV